MSFVLPKTPSITLLFGLDMASMMSKVRTIEHRPRILVMSTTLTGVISYFYLSKTVAKNGGEE